MDQGEKRKNTHFTTFQLDLDQVTLGADDLTEGIAFLVAGHPGGLLGIVRLGRVLTFHFRGKEQVFGGIRIGSGGLDDMAGHLGFSSSGK